MTRFALLAVFAAAVLSVFPASGFSRTWRVKLDGSGDVPTIQTASGGATPGRSQLRPNRRVYRGMRRRSGGKTVVGVDQVEVRRVKAAGLEGRHGPGAPLRSASRRGP
jgi:hypothetical protein